MDFTDFTRIYGAGGLGFVGDDECNDELCSGKEKPMLTEQRLRTYLAAKGITVRLNSITHEVEISGVPDEYDQNSIPSLLPGLLYDWLRGSYKGCSRQHIKDLLDIIAGRNKFNPALDLITSVQWDNIDRIGEVFKILGIQENDELSQTLICKWLIQCVSLLSNTTDRPFGADGILVLMGPQGIGKTSFVRALGMEPGLYKLGQYLDHRDKDTLRRCTSGWIIELGEIETTTVRGDMARLKAFLTQETDQYRMPYAATDSRYPRTASMIGTCNDTEFLVDPTGSRRFWTVPVNKIDLDRLNALDVLQLWAEVKALSDEEPQRFRLSSKEQAQLEARNVRHERPLAAQREIEDIFAQADSSPECFAWRDVTATQFKAEYESLRNYSVEKIGKALSKLGIASKSKKINGNVSQIRNLPMRRYSRWGV